MGLNDYSIRRIPTSTAMRVVVRHHYLHRKAPCSAAFGLFLASGAESSDPQLSLDGEALCGVVCYGTPSSAPLRSGIAGPEYAESVIELTRLWIADGVPKNAASHLIARTVRRAGKPIVVSFADISAGHIGTIYQAAGWIYTGLSAKRTDWTIDGYALHGQSIADKYDAATVRDVFGDRFRLKLRSRKHRYIWINAKGARRLRLIDALRYPPMPYPKQQPA